ncbi:MAG: hypothetical protein B7X37_03370 [Halothiobacillus sp. 14-55-98]|jgi:uncharacterized protein YigA (DUF484 family)|nr:MAG: hypothetical protein B7X37_03370 [Halothiobacillus sp. 14-55-98]
MTNEATAISLIDNNNQSPDNAAVTLFLQQNHGFLAEHCQTNLRSVLEDLLASTPTLLTEIKLPSPPDGVASLPHIQLRILRERLERLTHQINQLRITAEANARLDQVLHDFASDLLRTPQRTPEQLRTLLHQHFTVDAVELLRMTDITAQGKQILSGWLDSRTPLCGRLNEAQRQLIFDTHFPDTGSAALIAVGNNLAEPDWILALGRHAPDGFNPMQGTLFLRQIGDLAAAFLCPQTND